MVETTFDCHQGRQVESQRGFKGVGKVSQVSRVSKVSKVSKRNIIDRMYVSTSESIMNLNCQCDSESFWVISSSFGRLGNGRLVRRHDDLKVALPSPRSQSTMEWKKRKSSRGLTDYQEC